jgi:hypothetical protein
LRSIQHTLRTEPRGHGKWKSPTGLEGSCTLSRQCTIGYKFLIRVTLSDPTAINTRWHLLDTSVTFRCHCYHETATKVAFKSFVLEMSGSVDSTEVAELCSDQKHLSLYLIHQARRLRTLTLTLNRLHNRNRNILPCVAHTNRNLQCLQCINQLPRCATLLSCNTTAQN